ncbi:MAG: hypothetical protein IPK66_02760 [Rhodospirillales bacterium]|nr:hypothetical protein [Rhodospirillales bacterium]
MALSAIGLCSRALLKIGAQTITSFDEGTMEAEVAASLYPPVRDAVLSAHPWNFAIVQTVLAKLSDVPIADYANAFQLPSECIRVLSAGTGGRGQGIRYRVSRRQLHADEDDVVLTYIYRPDEADFPPFFDIALIAQLAAEFCIPLTDSTSRWDNLQKLAEAELRRAKLIDAQEDTPSAIEDFTLLEGRQ